MKTSTTSLRKTIGLIGALALIATLLPLSATASEGDAARQCQVKLDPQVVEAGKEVLTVNATPSEPIGTLVSADIDGEAAVRVSVVDDERQPDGHYALALDLSTASEGDWRVTLHGAHGECTGTVRIEARTAK